MTFRLRSHAAFAAMALCLVSACSLQQVQCGLPKASDAPAAGAPAAGGSGGSGGPDVFQISILGDSLTAGLGLLSDQAFPAILEQRFAAEGYSRVDVLNAGVSGDTTAGALRRVDQAITPDTRILVVALGGNDALRGLTTQETRENIKRIVDAALAKDQTVVVCGMEAPTNLGEDYRTAFREIFLQIARDYSGGRVYSVPFLLEGVAGNPALNQQDGIHPNAEGAVRIADLIYPRLRTLVDQLGGG